MSPSPGAVGRRSRILIVDDERQNRQLLEVMLAPEGFDLLTAPSGKAALAQVAREPPDLILLDVKMPGMDGYEVTRAIKDNVATQGIPVIMITNLDDREARMRGLSAGAEGFLSRPVNRAELYVRVRNLLRLKAHGDSHDQYSQLLEGEVGSRTADLRRAADRAQRYLDAAQVIMLALDLEGRITLVNRYACSALGRTADELLGRDWFETCLPARIRDALREKFRALVAGDLTIAENPIVTRSGEERLFEWRNTLVRDDAGHVTGTFSSGSDITERTKAVEALRTAEERMRFVLQSANVGIWDMDYATGALRWSATLEAQYGVAPGTFAGTFEAFVERIHPDDRAAVLATVGTAMKDGSDFTVLHRGVWPDGTVRWLSGAGRIHLGEHGQPVRGVGISLDVTERRALEEQSQQSHKMEAMGRMAGGVAHDFNNLLTGILGYCELLLEDFAPDDPRAADVAEIQKAGMSAAALTRQLLAFSRKQIIELTLLDLNAIITGVQGMLGRLIGSDMVIQLRLATDLELVKADRGQLEQIVINLAVNARDAMPGGGTLTIETSNVEIDAHAPTTQFAVTPGPHVLLTVSDTGTGITPEVLARLFEPFFTTKEVGRGTGLGLATVHGIVKRCGGSVNVTSELGKGTAFKVYFPRAEVVEAMAEPPSSAAPQHPGKQTVLVVEEAEPIRELTKRLLERKGYIVLLAANATEAVQLFEQHLCIDVLLTDAVMPGASGPELTRDLVAQRSGMKVIYMSGYTDGVLVHRGILEPGVTFLHKPFTSETLGRKLNELQEHEASDAAVESPVT